MKTVQTSRGRQSERGEGNAKFVLYLGFIVLIGWLLIKNVPMYFEVQNFKTDVAELCRGAGTQGYSADRVKKQANQIADKYGMDPSTITVSRQGDVLTVRLNVTKKINLLVTDYDWVINEEYTQTKF